jgi:hypothetical protein
MKPIVDLVEYLRHGQTTERVDQVVRELGQKRLLDVIRQLVYLLKLPDYQLPMAIGPTWLWPRDLQLVLRHYPELSDLIIVTDWEIVLHPSCDRDQLLAIAGWLRSEFPPVIFS